MFNFFIFIFNFRGGEISFFFDFLNVQLNQTVHPLLQRTLAQYTGHHIIADVLSLLCLMLHTVLTQTVLCILELKGNKRVNQQRRQKRASVVEAVHQRDSNPRESRCGRATLNQSNAPPWLADG